ncbi:MAG: hypothetical protein JWO13_1257 [Acidobacteriales bacterium]|nr:hypothetical protein [Terriglobales bacterium]
MWGEVGISPTTEGIEEHGGKFPTRVGTVYPVRNITPLVGLLKALIASTLFSAYHHRR